MFRQSTAILKVQHQYLKHNKASYVGKGKGNGKSVPLPARGAQRFAGS